ncbi:hypothetical protein GR140_18820 [Pseudomonas putida]|uniref:hypothetical protein n=1 Tax=Pseudomonas putida TaxID=303 RepID=UPI001BAE5E5A|nr:hypothetical protein [Pseudomonas putida]QUG90718.1 hypothetical protein GR140_18820 [Pseudomonas putida]
MELDIETKNNLFEITEDLMVIYAEEKVAKSKIPSYKQMTAEMQSRIIHFIAPCAFALSYSNERIEAYFRFMSKTVEELSDEMMAYIEIEQQ